MTAPKPIPRAKIIERLERLEHKLREDGLYVDANTAGLAVDELKGELLRAIEAIKAPSKAMILKGYEALMSWDARTGDSNGIWEVWEAMVDQLKRDLAEAAETQRYDTETFERDFLEGEDEPPEHESI